MRSQTSIHAFRFGRVTGHKAFVSFFHANIIANSIQIIITKQVDLKYRRSVATSNELLKIQAVVIRAVVNTALGVLTGNLGQFVRGVHGTGPAL